LLPDALSTARAFTAEKKKARQPLSIGNSAATQALASSHEKSRSDNYGSTFSMCVTD
jgi:hypothetical protein